MDVDENEMALGGRDMINVKFGTPTHYLSLYKVHQKCEILQQNRQNLLKRPKFLHDPNVLFQPLLKKV